MRQIGTVAGEQDVKRFADHLLTRGIKTQLEHGEQGWAVWVFDEDRVADARRELAEFQQNPADARYAASTAEADAIRTETIRREARAKSNVVDMKSRWSAPANGNWLVTFLLMAASIGVSYVTQLGKTRDDLIQRLQIASQNSVQFSARMEGSSFVIGPLQSLSEIRKGEVWRLVTPIFLHFGWIHIFFNMQGMMSLARFVEMRRGSFRFACIVLVLAVVSNLVQFEYASHRPGFAGSFGGMSGVLYGLFGYIWMKSRHDPASGFFMHPSNVVWMIGWLFLFMTGWVGPIANAAHVGGLVMGMILGYAPSAWRHLRGR